MWHSQPLCPREEERLPWLVSVGKLKLACLTYQLPFSSWKWAAYGLVWFSVPHPPPTASQVKATKSPCAVLRNPFSCHIYPHPSTLSLLIKNKKRWCFPAPPSHPLSYFSVQNPGEDREIMYRAPSKTSPWGLGNTWHWGKRDKYKIKFVERNKKDIYREIYSLKCIYSKTGTT